MLDTFHSLLTPLNPRAKTWRKGQRVFTQGAKVQNIFFVTQGQVQMQRVTTCGHLVVLHHAKAPALLAEASLFSERYHCDGFCTSDVCAFVISKSQVQTRLRQDADLAHAFMAHLAGQIHHDRMRLQILAMPRAEDRVFAALQSGLLKRSIRDLAAQIALSPEATYRALARLSKTGKVQKIAHGQYQFQE